jgi:hypothetical protein
MDKLFFVNSNHLLYLHLPKVVTKAAAYVWYAREEGLDPIYIYIYIYIYIDEVA